MRQRKAVAFLAVLILASAGVPAFANIRADDVQVSDQEKAEKLNDIAWLLDQLAKKGALEIKGDKVQVKESIVEELKRQGRFQAQMADNGGICE